MLEQRGDLVNGVQDKTEPFKYSESALNIETRHKMRPDFLKCTPGIMCGKTAP